MAMKSIPRRTYGIAVLVLAAIIFVALNIATDTALTDQRIDLTQNSLYTLSDGTKHTIANLKEPITLRFFYAKHVAADYAQIQTYAKRVRDLLQQYADLSGGKIILQEIDPEPFTAAEDQASSYGLTGAPTDSGDMVYFGLVGSNTIDGKEVIPFFNQDREAYLEYDLTSLIYRLSTPQKPKIGIITSLPLDTGAGGMEAALRGQARPYEIYEELHQAYDTEMLKPDFKSIPAGIDVLMIAHPPNLSDAQNYAIDQYVLKGGHALVFVDPQAELAAAGGGLDPRGNGPPSSNLGRLFHAWGIAFNPNKIIGDKELAQRVQVSADPRNPVAAYPVWLHLGKADFDTGDQITANLDTINLASAGALKPLKDATTKFTPLVMSSKQASLLDSAQLRLHPQPQELMAEIKPTGTRYTIAARITGPAKTAYPKGLPGDSAAAKTQIKQSAGPINVVVMADADIFDDRFWVREQNIFGKRVPTPFADNAAFVLNAVENLTGSNDLISLRTRATNDRPFTVVRALQAEAQAKFQQEDDVLKQRLADTQTRLQALEQGGSANGAEPKNAELTPEQKSEIEKFKRELVETRTALRNVQHNLRKEVDQLGTFLAFINIALVPLLVAGFALLLAILRRRRRARALNL